jgi:S1-C subfamily serine protease
MRRIPMVVSLLAASLMVGWCGVALSQRDAAARPRSVDPRGPLLDAEQLLIRRFKEAQPSVAYITTKEVRQDFWSFRTQEVTAGAGSGFLWDTRGHVVTNFHVIQGASRALVTLSDGGVHEAEYVGAAPDKDLAVLRIVEPPAKLRPIPIGTSADLQVGQLVIAIGNPFGLDQTLTTGIVSALGRSMESPSGRAIRDVIQTDAAINPGNSGGPLLDSAGRLVGVNTAIQSPSGASAGIGFAVPVDTVNRVVPQLIARGKLERPDLGFDPVAARWLERFGVKEGVMVAEVRRGGPGERAGLRGVQQDRRGRFLAGDLIVAANGRPVRTWDELLDLAEALAPGQALALEVRREAQRVTLSLRPGREPMI